MFVRPKVGAPTAEQVNLIVSVLHETAFRLEIQGGEGLKRWVDREGAVPASLDARYGVTPYRALRAVLGAVVGVSAGEVWRVLRANHEIVSSILTPYGERLYMESQEVGRLVERLVPCEGRNRATWQRRQE